MPINPCSLILSTLLQEPNNFYADENYIRVPPHVLSRPALIEIPKRFKLSSDPEYAKEVYLAIAVSHYFDEDEFSGGLQQFRRFVNRNGGDDTFTKRGHFVASSIHLYSEFTGINIAPFH